MRKIASIIAFCFVLNALKAQDTLPKFTIKDINDKKILITWTSAFGDNCIQLAVQRSFDSTHFFSTIYSAQSPELPQNGVIDSRMPKGVKVFYRIFYVLHGGQYFFSKSVGVYSFDQINKNIKQPPPIQPVINDIKVEDLPKSPVIVNTPPLVIQYLSIYKRTTDTLYERIESKSFKHLRDSITQKKDTLLRVDSANFIIKPFIPKPVWKASKFVFAIASTNNVNIKLPQPKLHKYRIVFFEENGTQLFEIKNPKEDDLILDNTVFVHGGWFSFDLYEDDKLKEHNKFQVLIPF